MEILKIISKCRNMESNLFYFLEYEEDGIWAIKSVQGSQDQTAAVMQLLTHYSFRLQNRVILNTKESTEQIMQLNQQCSKTLTEIESNDLSCNYIPLYDLQKKYETYSNCIHLRLSSTQPRFFKVVYFRQSRYF